MTNARFAQSIARLGSFCSAWAGDMLDGDFNHAVNRHQALRFVQGARDRLDFIESVLRETATPTQPQAGSAERSVLP